MFDAAKSASAKTRKWSCSAGEWRPPAAAAQSGALVAEDTSPSVVNGTSVTYTSLSRPGRDTHQVSEKRGTCRRLERNCYAALTTTIRLRFDDRSTAHQRSLRSQWRNTSPAAGPQSRWYWFTPQCNSSQIGRSSGRSHRRRRRQNFYQMFIINRKRHFVYLRHSSVILR